MKGMVSIDCIFAKHFVMMKFCRSFRHCAEPTALGISYILAESTESAAQKPEGILEYKPADAAFVDSSNDVTDTSIPCITAKAETLPKEDPLTDSHWSNFKEDVPVDTPTQYMPLEGCMPQAFEEDFNSVLYSSCGDYQQWVDKAVDVMQSNGQLAGKV